MGLRILLVGVVAALGLSLPTGEQYTRWGSAARSWVDDRLADRDSWGVGGDFLLVPEPTPRVAEPPVAVTEAVKAAATTPEPAPSTARPAADLASGDDTPTRPADLDDADAFTDLDEADLVTASPADPAPAAEPAPAPAPAPVVVGVAESDPAPAPVPMADDPDAAFDVAQNDVLAGLAADAVAAVGPSAPQVLVSTETEPTDASGDDFALVLNRASEGPDSAEFTPETPRGPRFEALDIGENLYEGTAYELNFGAEGLEHGPALAAGEPAGGAPPDRIGRLTTAVRLTREAVYAWANLLHGPAVVTLEP